MELVMFYLEGNVSSIKKCFITNDIIHDITENDSVAFVIRTKQEFGYKPVLWLTEVAYDLTFLLKDSEGFFVYDSSNNIYGDIVRSETVTIDIIPGNSIKIKLSNIFQNNFGKCEVLIQTHNMSPLVKLGDINVLSSKISDSDLNYLFDFLYRREVAYWKPLSIVESKELFEPKEHFIYLWLLKKIERMLLDISSNAYNFMHDPIVKLTTVSLQKKFSNDLAINDSSISWLFENLSNISRTNVPSNDSLKIKNKLYDINYIYTEQIKDSTNTYENKILHGFIEDLIFFLYSRKKTIKDKLEELYKSKVYKDKYKSLMQFQHIRFYERINNDTKHLINLAQKIKHTFDVLIPVSNSLIEFPLYDQGFYSKSHYLRLLLPIKEWFNRKANPIWGDLKIFAGTKSLDELFELFCLFKFLDALQSIGYNIIDRPKIVYNDISGNELGFVGSYFMKSLDDNELIVHYNKLPNGLETIIPTSFGSLRPDIVLEYKNKKSNVSSYSIFDAKYRKASSIDKHTYKDIIPKYLHGIGRVDNSKNGIDFLFLLHPPEANQTPIGFYHLKKKSLMSDSPVFPSIGRIQIPINDETNNDLITVLERIIYLLDNNMV